jgi:hypothetical protein
LNVQTEPRAGFGSAIAVSETAGLMVVGAPFQSSNSNSNSNANGTENVGAAYLYKRAMGHWQLEKVRGFEYLNLFSNYLHDVIIF